MPAPWMIFRRRVVVAYPIRKSAGGIVGEMEDAPSPADAYPYWVHCTGDVRSATFRVGDTLVHDGGRLRALDHPAVRAVAEKYPDRPGVDPDPRYCPAPAWCAG